VVFERCLPEDIVHGSSILLTLMLHALHDSKNSLEWIDVLVWLILVVSVLEPDYRRRRIRLKRGLLRAGVHCRRIGVRDRHDAEAFEGTITDLYMPEKGRWLKVSMGPARLVYVLTQTSSVCGIANITALTAVRPEQRASGRPAGAGNRASLRREVVR